MGYLGSSSVNRLSSTGMGNTGPTGDTGPKGPTGSPGPTGNTGASIIGTTGISLDSNRYVVTYFNNGTTYGVTGQAIGATGNRQYKINFSNAGTGYSLGYTASNGILKLRTIEFSNVVVTESGGVVTLNGSVPSTGVSATGANNNYNIVKFDAAGNLRGITGATGIVESGGVVNKFSFTTANIFETARGISFSAGTTNNNLRLIKQTVGFDAIINPFTIDTGGVRPAQAPRTFYLNLISSGGTAGVLNGLTLQVPSGWSSTSNKVYTVQVLVTNSKSNPQINKPKINSTVPIIWPNNTKPCISVTDAGATCDILMTFFYVKGNIYASSRILSSSNAQCSATSVYATACATKTLLTGETVSIEDRQARALFSTPNYSGIGACCTENGTCEQTDVQNCYGFFHGYGTTCGTTGSYACEKRGACCVTDGINQICYDDMSVSDCMNLRSIPGIVSNFSGEDLQCSEIVCDSQIFTGACCDGRGSCSTTTKQACEELGGFYHGHYSKCFDQLNNNICSGSTGACCADGVCTEVPFEQCINSNGIFAGYNKTCNNIVCSPENICSKYDSSPLLPGNKYGGGIVVGKFIPGKSKIFGAQQLFSSEGFKLEKGLTFVASFYTSQNEYEAGGITGNCYTEDGGYLIIVYPYDIALDSNYKLKNPYYENYTYSAFAWGNTGYHAWGPIINNGYYQDIQSSSIDYISKYTLAGEGYWSTGFTGTTQGQDPVLFNNTFKPCDRMLRYGSDGTEKVFGKEPYNLHGNWFRSWGMYNTLRGLYAQKTNTLGITESTGIINPTAYQPLMYNAFYVSRLIGDGITSDIQGNTANNVSLSGWFLPSHDELAFIAANTTDYSNFNLNQALLEKEGQPLTGTYWTSTGAFDYNKNEGISGGATLPNPGSVAISINFDPSGITGNYTVIKEPRSSLNKVRPIRIIRCDELYPNNSKLWNFPII